MLIKIHNSWKIPSNQIIAEIEYEGNGMIKDTQLISVKSKRQWIIHSRLIFSHTMDLQKRFPFETETFMTLQFENEEFKVKSINEIISKELSNIFQYLLKPIDHDEKPENHDELKII